MQEKQIKILKVRFDKVTLKEATDRVTYWLKSDRKRYLTTPNPEIVLEAQKNHKFLNILNHSNLNIADGAGIIWATTYLDSVQNTKSKGLKIAKWLSSLIKIPFSSLSKKNPLPERVTGTDLMQEICKNTDKRIFLLGAAEGVAKTAQKNLENKYPNVRIVETFAGSPSIEYEKEIIKKINSTEPTILFVAYGAPKQEIWIDRNLRKLRTVKIAIGVGGAFDFVAKSRKRAPRWMQKTGLEWAYRLIQEPSRFKRIYKATIKFPLTVLKNSLK